MFHNTDNGITGRKTKPLDYVPGQEFVQGLTTKRLCTHKKLKGIKNSQFKEKSAESHR